MQTKIKSATSLAGALIFLGITVYIVVQYGINIRAGLSSLIMLYFLVAAFLGLKSVVTMVFRVLLMSVILIYVISLYVG